MDYQVTSWCLGTVRGCPEGGKPQNIQQTQSDIMQSLLWQRDRTSTTVHLSFIIPPPSHTPFLK